MGDPRSRWGRTMVVLEAIAGDARPAPHTGDDMKRVKTRLFRTNTDESNGKLHIVIA